MTNLRLKFSSVGLLNATEILCGRGLDTIHMNDLQRDKLGIFSGESAEPLLPGNVAIGSSEFW